MIGASGRRGTVGHEIVHRTCSTAAFVAPIYPVNPKGDAVEGLTGYPSVDRGSGCRSISASSPSQPTRSAPLVADCAAKGARGLVVISGGFAEVGAEGAQRQRDLTSAARRHGMRIIGPNCVGVVNTDPCGPPRCDFRRRDGHTRSGRARLAIRRGRHRGAQRGDPSRHGHLELRLAGQQGRRQQQRSSCSTGRTTNARRWCSSISSRSATP